MAPNCADAFSVSIFKYQIPRCDTVRPDSFWQARHVQLTEIHEPRAAYYGLRRIVMSARSTLIYFAGKAGILFGALFLVSVLLAAIPSHRAPAPAQEAQQSSGSQAQE